MKFRYNQQLRRGVEVSQKKYHLGWLDKASMRINRTYCFCTTVVSETVATTSVWADLTKRLDSKINPGLKDNHNLRQRHGCAVGASLLSEHDCAIDA